MGKNSPSPKLASDFVGSAILPVGSPVAQIASNKDLVVSKSVSVGIAPIVVETDKETEEGEITPTSPANTLNCANLDGEWTKVTHSSGGGKHTEKGSTGGLVYGQVRIISPTRFDALRDTDEEESIVISKATSVDVITELDKVSIAVETEAVSTENHSIHLPGVGSGAMRPILARNSKNSHRVLGLSSQKAKDSIKSSLGKKKSKKNF